MPLTKLLAANAKPAPALVARAKKVVLSYAERVHLPKTVTVDGKAVEVAFEPERALEVGDVMLDEKGYFYAVVAAKESLMKVTGDAQTISEAAMALMARGVRLASVSGFSMVANEQYKALLENVGLKVEMVEEPFTPIPLAREEDCGCGCCHHHHEEETCSCGHHHDHGEECGCGCHHHDHAEGKECSCGHHHNHGEDCGCGCHHHDHAEGKECSCGHHHDHGEECGCGCHHHEEGKECQCKHSVSEDTQTKH